jgi:hypothetical protein
MITEPTVAHKCMKMYDTHRVRRTCFGHSCGHLQGGVLHRNIKEKLERIHKYIYPL